MNKKGFTLVETMTVITIIALIGLITVPVISNQIESSKRKSYKITIQNIVEAIKIYQNDNVLPIENGKIKIDVTESFLEYENKNEIKSGFIEIDTSGSKIKYRAIKIYNGEYCANNDENSDITSDPEIYIKNGDCSKE